MSYFNIEALKAGAASPANPTDPAPPAPGTPAPAAPAQPAAPAPGAPAPAAPATPAPGNPAPGTEPNQPGPAQPAQPEPGSPAAPAEPGADNNTPTPPKQGSEGGDQSDPAAPPAQPAPGAPPAAPSQPTEEEKQAQAKAADDIAAAARQKILDELGLESMEVLKAKLAPAPEETPEQKKRREDLFKNDVQNYAVRELEMSPEEFVNIERNRQTSDEDLAFEVFSKKWIAANKDSEAMKGKDLAVEARYEFESLFHLQSENERLKALGQESLAATAEAIRQEGENKYKVAESEYRGSLDRAAKVGSFKSTVQSTIKAHLPQELKYTVDDAAFTYQLDKVDTADLEKYLATQANFDFFQEKGGQETGKLLQQRIKDYVAIHHADKLATAAFKSGLDAGMKRGAIGAKAPFTAPAPPAPAPTNGITKEDDEKVKRVAGGQFV
jgi:hypothetical protein